MSSIVSWILRKGRLVEKGSREDFETRAPRGPRGDLATPYITRDSLSAPVQSQTDGRTYESRSDLYKEYKEKGVRVVEAGEQPVDYVAERPRVTKDEIGEALQKVKQGYKPDPLEQAGPDGSLSDLPDDPQLPLNGI